jgi:hypothetical protein
MPARRGAQLIYGRQSQPKRPHRPCIRHASLRWEMSCDRRSSSQVIAGSIVHHLSFRAGFLFLAAVAAAGFSILLFFMPETRNARAEPALAARRSDT